MRRIGDAPSPPKVLYVSEAISVGENGGHIATLEIELRGSAFNLLRRR